MSTSPGDPVSVVEDLTLGQKDSAHSKSVVLASDHPPLTAVIDEETLATAAAQATGNAALTSIDGHVDGLEASATATAASLLLIQQPTRSAAVTKSDSTDITATATKGLWVGTAGDLSVKYAGDSAATTLKGVAAGTYVPGAFSRVMAATTAADIVSLYGP